ncbi:hypothetical protein U4E84_11950 [Halorubrum sp. AD140]|uniref:DUF7289 family protein n=1 Tax=Halorubrum sp. AD140 TaxID=3050073 RepID=UPI002ACCBE48|nr:hypothetical protein [Halorubrum sp. AD140]MDZ5812055.1 hypothetical protein [Halorubrum sp. AD140]
MSRRRRPTVSIGGTGGCALGGDDRGVSDVVGYVLVFSLITITIGTVFAVGITGVEDRREAERVENVERAFDVFDDNVRDVQRYDDPGRSTEIRLSGGTLSLTETTTVTLRNETGDVVLQREHRSLTYANGDATVAYETGAWFRGDGDGAVMRSEPRFVAAGDRTTLPLVLLYPVGDATARGDGTVQVGASRRSTIGSDYTDAGDGPYELRIDSTYADAWERYFDRTDGFDVNETATESADGAVVVDLTDDDAVYVPRIALDVSLRR